jgi:hypothetical protein
MNALISRLLGRKRTTTMTNDVEAARARLDELQGQLNAIETRIRDGEASPQDFEDRPTLLARVQGAREACGAAEGRESRNVHRTQEDDFRRRVAECMDTLAELFPRMTFCLTDLQRLAMEAHEIPFSASTAPAAISDLFNGLPSDFAGNMLRVMREAAPGVEWHYAMPGERHQRPTLRRDNRVVQLGRAELPPNSSGIVNMGTGEVVMNAP